MENAVYVELHHSGRKIYFHRDKHDCDFLIQEKNKIISAIQVTEEITEDNERRELNGLMETMEKYGLDEGIVLTLNQEITHDIDGKTIKILPVWLWLLQQS